MRLEKAAGELRGEARLTAVRRWVSVLTELAALTGGAGGVGAAAAGETEWQQLHLTPFEAGEQLGTEPLALKARLLDFDKTLNPELYALCSCSTLCLVRLNLNQWRHKYAGHARLHVTLQ